MFKRHWCVCGQTPVPVGADQGRGAGIWEKAGSRTWLTHRPSPPPPLRRGAGVTTHHPASASLCTPATARPEGSAIFAKLASQAIAAGEEQAIDLPPGTVSAAAWPGKK